MDEVGNLERLKVRFVELCNVEIEDIELKIVRVKSPDSSLEGCRPVGLGRKEEKISNKKEETKTELSFLS